MKYVLTAYEPNLVIRAATVLDIPDPRIIKSAWDSAISSNTSFDITMSGMPVGVTTTLVNTRVAGALRIEPLPDPANPPPSTVTVTATAQNTDPTGLVTVTQPPAAVTPPSSTPATPPVAHPG